MQDIGGILVPLLVAVYNPELSKAQVCEVIDRTVFRLSEYAGRENGNAR